MSSSRRKVNLFKVPFAPPEHIETELQYNVRTISQLSELRPGDHIKVNKEKYDHHLLVVKVVSDEEVHVIHYSNGDEGPKIRFQWPPTRPDMGLITEEVRRTNPAKVTVLTFRDAPETVYTAEEAFERARTRLGEKRWELFTNNCEHLVNWALTGVARSSQHDAVKKVGEDFAETAVKVGVFLGPAVGAAAGLVKAVSSYKQYRDDVKKSEESLQEPQRDERGEEALLGETELAQQRTQSEEVGTEKH